MISSSLQGLAFFNRSIRPPSGVKAPFVGSFVPSSLTVVNGSDGGADGLKDGVAGLGLHGDDKLSHHNPGVTPNGSASFRGPSCAR